MIFISITQNTFKALINKSPNNSEKIERECKLGRYNCYIKNEINGTNSFNAS